MESVTASAPGRVNLIGEHLDYNGGLCLPIAIDRRTTVTVRRAATASARSDHEPEGWTRYVDGVLAELQVDVPLAVSVSSDVPVGAGLSSSAALTCATAVAADALLDLGQDRDALAKAAIRSENDHVGVPSGGMDQAASLFGEAARAVLLDFGGGGRHLVPWAPEAAGFRLLVIDTGVKHALADGQYASRRAECETAAEVLGVEHLALAPARALDALVGPERRRARHVVSEQARVQDFVKAAGAGRWHTAGALMTASHRSLREDFDVSCPELDVAVEASLSAGARGARMTGGGFGGSAIALVPDALAGGVTAAVGAAYRENGWEAPTVFPVEASRGASVDQIT